MATNPNRKKVQPQTGTNNSKRQPVPALLRRSLTYSTKKSPSGITARRNAIIQYGISYSTLTKHKDLWHPQFLTALPAPPAPQELQTDAEACRSPQQAERSLGGLLHSITTNKLVTPAVLDAPQQASEDSSLFEEGGFGGISTEEVRLSVNSPVVMQQTQRPVDSVPTEPKATLLAIRINKVKVRSDAYVARMQRYLKSGDPILMAEAQQWLMALQRKGWTSRE